MVKREVKDGMYSPLAYVCSQLCLQLPMLALMSLLPLFPAIYPIANWEVRRSARSLACAGQTTVPSYS